MTTMALSLLSYLHNLFFKLVPYNVVQQKIYVMEIAGSYFSLVGS